MVHPFQMENPHIVAPIQGALLVGQHMGMEVTLFVMISIPKAFLTFVGDNHVIGMVIVH
jgi:hypothetical protein